MIFNTNVTNGTNNTNYFNIVKNNLFIKTVQGSKVVAPTLFVTFVYSCNSC